MAGGDARWSRPRHVVTAMRARELGRTSIVVGDDVGIVGDLSGKTDTLARIVRRGERRTVLRRTADDTDPTERVLVANADQLLIVVALADPPPRTGLVERTLIAAYAGGLEPILCLTKTDLAPPEPFAEQFADLDLTVTTAGRDDPSTSSPPLLADKVTVLLGHSGVGKSTLVNRLVPEADRATGEVSGVGKGRYTSTQSVALPLRFGGWVVDTPGIRSFGLAHIEPDDVMLAFSDLAERSRTALAAAGIWVRPPIPNARWTPDRPRRRPRGRGATAARCTLGVKLLTARVRVCSPTHRNSRAFCARSRPRRARRVGPVTEPDFLQRTRNGYDLTAAMYAERFHTHLDDRPLDRAMLAGFAGLVDANAL